MSKVTDVKKWCESRVQGKYTVEKSAPEIWVYVEGHVSVNVIPKGVTFKSVNQTDTKPYDFILLFE